MEIERRADRDEATYFSALLEKINYLWQGRISQTVAIVGKKNILVADMIFYSEKPLTNVSPQPRIHQCDAPIWRALAQYFNFVAKVRNHTIACCRRLIVQNIVLNHICFVTKAKDKIAMTVIAVILHDVP